MAEGGTDVGSLLWRSLPILIVNGATLLIVVVMMIRSNAKIQERLFNGFTSTITTLKDEIVGLRRDIRDTSTANAVAIGSLTDRVSRIEGVLLARQPEIASYPEIEEPTPVGPVPTAHHPTPIPTTPMPQLEGRRSGTPPAGVSRIGTYGPHKPPKG